MQNKKNVLIVHNYYQISGGEDTVVFNEKKLLEDHGYKVVLYTRNNSELKSMSFFEKLWLPITTIYNPKTSKDIKKIIKEENIDVVHVHNTLNLISPSVYYAALKMKKPVIQTIHNFRMLCPGATLYRDGHVCEECIQYNLGCAIKHNCYRGSKVQTLACVISTVVHRLTGIYGKIDYICLTEFNKNKLLNLKQIKSENIYVKPNFVKNSGKRYERGNDFVFVGRVDALKGVDTLFKAWEKMGKNAPNLIICGTGPLEEWCQNYIKERNINNIQMMGKINNIQVREIIGRCRALILPTRVYEGFPMTIAEAFSEGTPVLTSNIGNSGDLIREGVTGYKFTPGSEEGIIECVNKIMNGKDLTDSVQNEYDSKYTEDINLKILEKIYEEVCIKRKK